MIFKRCVYISGEILQEKIMEAKSNLLTLSTEKSDEPIYIIIDSSGGDQTQAISFIDVVNLVRETSEVEVNTVNFGECVSAGFLIFLCGDNRLCLKSSVFMAHESSITVDSTETKSLSSYINLCSKIRDKVITEMLKNTKMKPKSFFEKIKNEWWFDAEEAKKLGIVSEII